MSDIKKEDKVENKEVEVKEEKVAAVEEVVEQKEEAKEEVAAVEVAEQKEEVKEDVAAVEVAEQKEEVKEDVAAVGKEEVVNAEEDSDEIKYPNYISKKRIGVEPPEFLVDKLTGKPVFGTFTKEISNINLLDCKGLYPFGRLFNKARYTHWEALELHFDECAIVSAVYNMGIIGFAIVVLFDKRDKSIKHWIQFVPGGKAKVAPNLIDTVTSQDSKKLKYHLHNMFHEGYATAQITGNSKKFGDIEIDVKITNVAKPSVVNIPFEGGKSLYSQKNLFKAEGKIVLNGETFEANENSVAIIDDHKGFYPFEAHYDWLTTMGTTEIDGKKQVIGFNLTKNQSISQYDYNENWLWLEGEGFSLPPVEFRKVTKSKWEIKDALGKVDLIFELDNTYKMKFNIGLIYIKYYLPFGTLKGTITNYDGKVYNFDGMLGIAEDKTTKI